LDVPISSMRPTNTPHPNPGRFHINKVPPAGPPSSYQTHGVARGSWEFADTGTPGRRCATFGPFKNIAIPVACVTSRRHRTISSENLGDGGLSHLPRVTMFRLRYSGRDHVPRVRDAVRMSVPICNRGINVRFCDPHAFMNPRNVVTLC